MCRAACPQAAAGCSGDCNVPGASGTSTPTCRGGCLHPPVRLSRDCRCKINAAKPLRPSLRSATSPRCGEAFWPCGRGKNDAAGGAASSASRQCVAAARSFLFLLCKEGTEETPNKTTKTVDVMSTVFLIAAPKSLPCQREVAERQRGRRDSFRRHSTLRRLPFPLLRAIIISN